MRNLSLDMFEQLQPQNQPCYFLIALRLSRQSSGIQKRPRVSMSGREGNAAVHRALIYVNIQANSQNKKKIKIWFLLVILQRNLVVDLKKKKKKKGRQPFRTVCLAPRKNRKRAKKRNHFICYPLGLKMCFPVLAPVYSSASSAMAVSINSQNF